MKTASTVTFGELETLRKATRLGFKTCPSNYEYIGVLVGLELSLCEGLRV
jgi:hypothetical protein